jgi:TfoX/Sxy family transcriptional regulator of competence genes
MAVSDGFKQFVRDLLADFGPVTIRNMFGGVGVTPMASCSPFSPTIRST